MQDALFVHEALREFRRLKALGDRALVQVDDRGYFAMLDDQSNSLALVVKHVAGNLSSRWTDFLTSDGEKPDRQRDREFELDEGDSRAALTAAWEDGWRRLFEALEGLGEGDVDRVVLIRGEPHTVARAVNRQISHYAYHVGQIAMLARHYAGSRWETLSIPRGQSEAFNRAMLARQEKNR